MKEGAPQTSSREKRAKPGRISGAGKSFVAVKLYLVSAYSFAQTCIQDLSAAPGGNSCSTPVQTVEVSNPNPVTFVGDCILDLSAADPGTCPQPVPGISQPFPLTLMVLIVVVAALGRLVTRSEKS